MVRRSSPLRQPSPLSRDSPNSCGEHLSHGFRSSLWAGRRMGYGDRQFHGRPFRRHDRARIDPRFRGQLPSGLPPLCHVDEVFPFRKISREWKAEGSWRWINYFLISFVSSTACAVVISTFIDAMGMVPYAILTKIIALNNTLASWIGRRPPGLCFQCHARPPGPFLGRRDGRGRYRETHCRDLRGVAGHCCLGCRFTGWGDYRAARAYPGMDLLAGYFDREFPPLIV